MEGWATGRRRARIPQEERLNRDGRWIRQFHGRSDVWPIFEHWAAEGDYRLAAVRGQRRLYVLNAESSFSRAFVDIRVEGEGDRVTLIAWIEVGFLGRLLWALQLPGEMTPNPGGPLAGLRTRRRFARSLNLLLERMRQAPIMGSTRFNPVDLDESSLALFLAMVAVGAGFLVPPLRGIEIRAGLSNGLLQAVGKQALFLLGAAIPMVMLHVFFAERLPRLLRWLYAGAGFGAFFIVAVVTLTRTANEMKESKFAYHCLAHFSEPRCRAAIGALPPKERDAYLGRLRAVEKELSFSYPRPLPPQPRTR